MFIYDPCGVRPDVMPRLQLRLLAAEPLFGRSPRQRIRDVHRVERVRIVPEADMHKGTKYPKLRYQVRLVRRELYGNVALLNIFDDYAKLPINEAVAVDSNTWYGEPVPGVTHDAAILDLWGL
ncbi:MAG TPA: hypothetical protein VND64_32475 [Pirellulales bacterium]|nr:hypothetical protein [Pirellulales bacterium]